MVEWMDDRIQEGKKMKERIQKNFFIFKKSFGKTHQIHNSQYSIHNPLVRTSSLNKKKDRQERWKDLRREEDKKEKRHPKKLFFFQKYFFFEKSSKNKSTTWVGYLFSKVF
jgi:tRNA splicing endonuclease